MILKRLNPLLRRSSVTCFIGLSNNLPTHLPMKPTITSPQADSQRRRCAGSTPPPSDSLKENLCVAHLPVVRLSGKVL
jgi:hypothetical protein